MSVHVIGPLKLPLKIVPFGRPFEPLPVIVKLPPEANVPPIVSNPLVKAPVVSARVPRLPVMTPPPPKPFTEVKVEPVSAKPLLVPVSVPPVFVNSTLFPSAVTGSAKVSRIPSITRRINILPEHHLDHVILTNARRERECGRLPCVSALGKHTPVSGTGQRKRGNLRHA